MNAYVFNILDMIEKHGEEDVLNDLSVFSSPLNPEIEGFIRDNAIDFAKRKLSIDFCKVVISHVPWRLYFQWIVE